MVCSPLKVGGLACTNNQTYAYTYTYVFVSLLSLDPEEGAVYHCGPGTGEDEAEGVWEVGGIDALSPFQGR